MISVCLATYNGERYIGEQLASILSQLSADDEVIVSDDGSTDTTLDIVKSFNSPIVKVVDGPRKGLILNFEHALKVSKGDYVFLSDQDDKWVENKVEVMVNALQSADCVVSDCFVTDGDFKITSDSFYALNRTHTGWLYNLFIKNGYLGCCMAMKRNVIEKAIPFPQHLPMHDIWLGNIAAAYFKCVFIPDRLIYFRRHHHNASMTARKSENNLWQKLQIRNTVIKGLLGKFFLRR